MISVLIVGIPDYTRGLTVKKATTKRERKYGKKNENGIRTTETSKERVVKVMVENAYIMKFKSLKEAKVYINKSKKEAEERGHPSPSFVFI